MIDIWGEKDFETLYKEFCASSWKGKIFMMKDYDSEDTSIGRGATILLHKTSLFILGLLKDLYFKDNNYIIGDIWLLLTLADHRTKKLYKKMERLRAKNVDRATLRKMQLNHLLKRKQKSLNPLKNNTEVQKRKD